MLCFFYNFYFLAVDSQDFFHLVEVPGLSQVNNITIVKRYYIIFKKHNKRSQL